MEGDVLTRAARLQAELEVVSGLAMARSTCVRWKLGAQAGHLRRIGRLLARDPRSGSALRDWQALAESARPAAHEVDALVHWVLHELCLQAGEDLRRQVARARPHEAAGPWRHEDARTVPSTLQPPRQDLKQHLLRRHARGELSRDELERALDTVGEDGQLTQLALQEAMRKQQLLFSRLSDLSKMLHAMVMAMIVNRGK